MDLCGGISPGSVQMCIRDRSYTTAKNATTGDYRRATGFEAVMGYLYLTDQYCRMIDLIKMGLEALKDGK